MAQTADVQTLRAEFPLTGEWSYLNHAAHGPYPLRTVQAIKEYADGWSNPATFDTSQNEAITQEVRESIAELANGRPDRVAFTGSLADGMNIMAHGLDWNSGDNVLIPEGEFPSVVYPFLNLERKGATVRFVEKSPEGRTDIDRIEAAIDDRTRAVALSHVEFNDGYRNDLHALGKLCRSRGIELFVDATQSLGAQPVDVAGSGVTAIAAHGYKWLLSAFGTGVVVFAEDALERIKPTYAGRLSVKANFQDPEFRLDWRDGADRFQTGGINMLTMTAMRASLSLVREAGPEWTADHTGNLVSHLANGLTGMGYQVVSDLGDEHRSQIIAFTSGDREQDGTIVDELERRNVSVCLRGKGVRVSPYFYNTIEDIDQMLESLPPR